MRYLLDFWGNLLGALVGTLTAFGLGVASERHTTKRKNKDRVKILKSNIVRLNNTISSVKLIKSFYFDDKSRLTSVFNDIKSNFSELDQKNALINDALLTLGSKKVSVKSIDDLNKKWFTLRSFYMSYFCPATEKFLRLGGTESADLAVKLNNLQTEMNENLQNYVSSLDFIELI